MDITVVIRIVIVVALVAAILYYRRTQRADTVKTPKLDPMRHQGSGSSETRHQGAIEVKMAAADPSAAPAREPGIYQRTTSVDGTKLAYVEAIAESSRGSVLLLHGFGGDKRDWAGVLRPMLDAGFDVYALDLPGFGDSLPANDTTWDVKSLIKLLRLWGREVGLDRFHLVGASIGATLAACYAYAVSKEVMSLVLIEPLGLRVPYESDLDKVLARGHNPLVAEDDVAYHYQLEFLHATPPDMPTPVRQARTEAAVAGHDNQLAVYSAMMEGDQPHILDLVLPDVEARTLILLGEKSRVVHEATGNVARDMMRSARVISLPEVGHRPMVEAPAETAEALLSFLRSVTGS